MDEHHRVSVRNIRRDGNEAVKKLLKDKKITEDDDKKAHDEIQKLTDACMEKLDQAARNKEKEIMEIRKGERGRYWTRAALGRAASSGIRSIGADQ